MCRDCRGCAEDRTFVATGFLRCPIVGWTQQFGTKDRIATAPLQTHKQRSQFQLRTLFAVGLGIPVSTLGWAFAIRWDVFGYVCFAALWFSLWFVAEPFLASPRRGSAEGLRWFASAGFGGLTFSLGPLILLELGSAWLGSDESISWGLAWAILFGSVPSGVVGLLCFAIALVFYRPLFR